MYEHELHICAASLCHAHDITKCLCASYTITYSSSSLRSLIIVFTVSMANAAGFLCRLNDQRVKTTLHVHRLCFNLADPSGGISHVSL